LAYASVRACAYHVAQRTVRHGAALHAAAAAHCGLRCGLQNTPEAAPKEIVKPSPDTLCPSGSHTLKLKYATAHSCCHHVAAQRNVPASLHTVH
jgi:hypothetical protein